MISIQLNLPVDIYDRLSKLFERTGRSTNDYMVEAITEYVCDLEDVYLCDQRLAANREGESKASSLESVIKRFELGGLD